MDEFSKNYGIIAIMGVFGAIVKRLRKRMSWIRFAGTIVISIFVAIVTGVFVREWTTLSEEATFAVCGVAGVFSDEILDEVLEIIKSVKFFITKWVNQKTGSDDTEDNT